MGQLGVRLIHYGYTASVITNTAAYARATAVSRTCCMEVPPRILHAARQLNKPQMRRLGTVLLLLLLPLLLLLLRTTALSLATEIRSPVTRLGGSGQRQRSRWLNAWRYCLLEPMGFAHSACQTRAPRHNSASVRAYLLGVHVVSRCGS